MLIFVQFKQSSHLTITVWTSLISFLKIESVAVIITKVEKYVYSIILKYQFCIFESTFKTGRFSLFTRNQQLVHTQRENAYLCMLFLASTAI